MPPGAMVRKAALLALFAAGVVAAGWRCRPGPGAARGQPRAVTGRGPLFPEEQAVSDRFKEASPSVVYITTLVYQRDWFSANQQGTPRGTGSGFVWDREGHIVTNYHLIEDAHLLEVTLADRSSHKARVVGAAPEEDLAVLQLHPVPGGLRPIPVGRSADLQVGQTVLAIGNPFGLDQTLTLGVVSALEREIQGLPRRRIRGVIQTDAAINPGNSGGPLLDSAGRLIGVNTAIQSQSGSFTGIGFAVPVDAVNRVVPRIIAGR
jgi:S1-C subfamily serine protease